MRALGLFGVVGFCLGVLSTPAWAYFYTGFEPPKYEPGLVQGQHGWLGNAEVVEAPHPTIQTQSLRQGPTALRIFDPPMLVGDFGWSWYFDGSTYSPTGPDQVFLTGVFSMQRRGHGEDRLLYDDGYGWKDLGFDIPWNRWVRFRVVVDPGTLNGVFYMDDVPLHAFVPKGGNEIVGLIVGGAGSETANAMYLDELYITPEPTAAAVLTVGTVLLRRRR